ncbi:MAG TPA: VWA domain-containing protein [Azospirillum sp.]|nr:VWA domain-containing protein [Azospirillum sp.]
MPDGFAGHEAQARAYVAALWNRDLAMRAVPADRPASFDESEVRVPAAFRGWSGEAEGALYRATLAHVAAHRVFSARQPVGALKPVQVVLVGLVEDARVEWLAIRAFPGLRRLWLPFHVAEPSGALLAPDLMARLARALLDPDYRDGNGWVEKGRALFLERRERWDDPAVAREVGGLLGNDLGQMRVRFDARAHVVEPLYRDDNSGLWDPPAAAEPGEGAGAPQPSGQPAQAVVTPGVPAARYPEWDYRLDRSRPDFARVVDCPVPPAHPGGIDRLLARDPGLARRIATLVRRARVSEAVRLRRQAEGDRLDLDACIGAAIERRAGAAPDPRLYAATRRLRRDLSVLVLLDVSRSTADPAGDGTVLDLQRHATALLAEAMAALGDTFAILAFCSRGREDVRIQRVKDFDAPYGAAAKARLAGLEGGWSTRLGAALRHAGAAVAGRPTHRRLVLVLTDGEPSDIDSGDPRYLVEDARRAVAELARRGVDVFGIGLGAGPRALALVFGRRNALCMDRVERLPETLPALYLRLTR